MKFFMISLATLLASFFGSNACNAGHGSFNGFYAGLAGGIATHQVKNHIFGSSTFLSIGNEIFLDTASENIYKLRPWGEVFGGWGRQCSCFYWGGRLGVNFSQFNVKFNTHAIRLDPTDESNLFLDNSIKTKTHFAEFTFDFKPGLIFCSRTMLFGIVGGAVNKLTVEAKSDFVKIAAPASNVNIHTVNDIRNQKTSAGLRLGVGLEHMLSNCWSIQLAYTYTRYWRLQGRRVLVTSFQQPTFTTTHIVDFNARASKMVTSIGISYYF